MSLLVQGSSEWPHHVTVPALTPKWQDAGLRANMTELLWEDGHLGQLLQSAPKGDAEGSSDPAELQLRQRSSSAVASAANISWVTVGAISLEISLGTLPLWLRPNLSNTKFAILPTACWNLTIIQLNSPFFIIQLPCAFQATHSHVVPFPFYGFLNDSVYFKDILIK